MQYPITDRAAIEFSRSFYEAIADGLPVDIALAEARKSVSVAINNTLEWGTPVLFMRSEDGVLFKIRRPREAPGPVAASSPIGAAGTAALGVVGAVAAAASPAVDGSVEPTNSPGPTMEPVVPAQAVAPAVEPVASDERPVAPAVNTVATARPPAEPAEPPVEPPAAPLVVAPTQLDFGILWVGAESPSRIIEIRSGRPTRIRADRADILLTGGEGRIVVRLDTSRAAAFIGTVTVADEATMRTVRVVARIDRPPVAPLVTPITVAAPPPPAAPPIGHGDAAPGTVARPPRRTWPWVAAGAIAVIAVALILGRALLSPGEMVVVPELVGLPLTEARAALDKACDGPPCFAVEEQPITTADYPPGVVCRQSLQAGTSVDKGSPMVLCVSQGPDGACVPELLAPGDGTVVDNGRLDRTEAMTWTFSWSQCPGADRYELIVTHSGSRVSTIDEVITDPTLTRSDRSYIADQNRFDWTWQVRSATGGTWGAWSKVGTFEVEPVNSDPAPTPS
jgi:hypothetical protein